MTETDFQSLAQTARAIFGQLAANTFFNKLQLTTENAFATSGFLDPQTAEKLQRRAASKFLSKVLADELVKIQDSPLIKQYQRSVQCGEVIEEHSYLGATTAKSKFCTKRWCLICNRIKTANLINIYNPVLQQLTDKQFVTLTCRNVVAGQLNTKIKQMIKDYQLIQDKLRKQGIKLKGIRKLECTYNSIEKTFHPHFHLIIEGQAAAEKLRDNWIDQDPENRILIANQVKPATAGSEKEIFKYFTKISANNKNDKTVNIYALDWIFRSVQGIRIFQPVGIQREKVIFVNVGAYQMENKVLQYIPGDLPAEMLQHIEMIRQIVIDKKEQPYFLNVEQYRIFTWQHDQANWLEAKKQDPVINFEPTEKTLQFSKRITYENDFRTSWPGTDAERHKDPDHRKPTFCEKIPFWGEGSIQDMGDAEK